MSEQPTAWHTLTSEQVVRQLDTNIEKGLTSRQVADRRAQYGLNELVEADGTTLIDIVVAQFRDVMVLVLIAAALISLLFHEYVDATVILAIVILNAILGVVQEYRAEQAMAALKKMSSPAVRVRRDGGIHTVDASDLMPGDVMLLEAGDAISADARMIENASLRTEEASLTGESEPISKTTNVIDDEKATLGDRKNMVYRGTVANYGRGIAVVTETGMSTELGRIAELIQGVENDMTPLQKRMDQLGKILALVAVGIIALVFILGILRAEELNREVLTELVLTAIAMAVAAIPEGLPAVVTIALALGAQQMLKRQALIRKLPAVETLGSVTTICSDKTGTLTQNRMTVQVLDMANEKLVLEGQKEAGVPQFRLVEGVEDIQTLELTLVGSALCNDAIIQRDPDNPSAWQTIGDPTEAALLMAAELYGLSKGDLDSWFPRVAEIPFSSDRKRMTTIHQITEGAVAKVDPNAVDDFAEFEGRVVSFTKGAFGIVLDICDRIWVNEEVIELDSVWRERAQQAHDKLAAQGLRVLGVGFRIYAEKPSEAELDSAESELTFLGLVGMIDPPRPEVAEAVRQAKTAGIRPVMITGDHPITAKEIAKQLGIAEEGARVVTGKELTDMSMTELESIVEEVPVFARVSPEHKLRIVEALQNKGHITAMTGDGVNDAPALRKSDIGVAMGITGTDVSKEAADMVILDDNFATIVAAVREGRNIYDNVRKFLQYILTSNAGEIYVMLLAPFLGMPLPLIPLQILWINLVTDGLPGLALSTEQAERDIMTRPPFAPDESIFSRGIGWRVLWAGLLMGLVSLAVGYAGFRGWLVSPYDDPETTQTWWRTLVFTTLTLSQMGNALAVRSNRDSIFKIGLFSNRLMLLAIGATFLLQLAVIYVPFLQRIFGTVGLSVGHLVLALILSTVVFWAIELEKLIRRPAKATA